MILYNYRSFEIHVVNFGIYSELFSIPDFFFLYVVSAFVCKFPVILDKLQVPGTRFCCKFPPCSAFKLFDSELTQVGGKARTKQLMTEADESPDQTADDAFLPTPTDAQFYAQF